MNDNLIKLAISKAISAKEAREASSSIPEGEYSVEACVWVRGTLKRGKDYEQRIVAKADPWNLLAVALSKLNGVTVDSIVREALEADSEAVKVIKEQAQEAMDEVKAPTVTKCNGKISASISAEILVDAGDAEVVTIEVLREAIKNAG